MNLRKILHDTLPREMEIKRKVNECNLVKPRRFCTIKKTICQVERQPSGCEIIITKETTDKRLISKIDKHLIQINTRKTNNLIKKWGKHLNILLFSKEDMHATNKHIK